MEGAIFSAKYKLGIWDGKIRFFKENGITYFRLLEEIIPDLVEFGYEIELKDERISQKGPTLRATEDMFADCIGYGGKPMMLRPYQVEDVNDLINAGSGYGLFGTGYGKTSLCAAISKIYESVGYKTIIIVPSADLVVQTVSAYKMLKLDVGSYSGDLKELDKTHVIATWQSLQNNPNVMKLFQVVIVDESHGIKGDVIRDLISTYGAHIAFRFGLTGTFPKPLLDQYYLKTSIGQIIKERSAKWLMDNGYLAKVKIDLVETQEFADLPDYTAEKSFLERNEDRVDLIAEDIMKQRDKYGNTLVLVNSIKFGKKLAKQIPNSVFLYGQTKNETRQEHYSEFDEKDGLIVIANSQIASTGLSIDRIFCLYLLDTGKSFIKTIQSIGRSLRMASDKNEAYVRDVSSALKFSKKHKKDRIKYYKEAGYEYSSIIKLGYYE